MKTLLSYYSHGTGVLSSDCSGTDLSGTPSTARARQSGWLSCYGKVQWSQIVWACSFYILLCFRRVETSETTHILRRRRKKTPLNKEHSSDLHFQWRTTSSARKFATCSDLIHIWFISDLMTIQIHVPFSTLFTRSCYRSNLPHFRGKKCGQLVYYCLF